MFATVYLVSSLSGLHELGGQFPVWAKDVFFATTSSSALDSTQPIQWVLRTISSGKNRPGREADHSPPSTANVKNAWSYTSISIRLHDVMLN
jgi:hypothetical protein